MTDNAAITDADRQAAENMLAAILRHPWDEEESEIGARFLATARRAGRQAALEQAEHVLSTAIRTGWPDSSTYPNDSPATVLSKASQAIRALKDKPQKAE